MAVTASQNLVNAFEVIATDIAQAEARLERLESNGQQVANPVNIWPITPPELLPPDPAGELPAWAVVLDEPSVDLALYRPLDLHLACLGYNLFDLQLNAGLDVATDATLDTAILISLFTDRYDPETQQGGWWGDNLPSNPSKMGSRLWRLNKSKVVPQVLRDAESYAKESLAWLLEDGLLKNLTVSAKWERADGGIYQIRIAIAATINNNSHYGKPLSYSYLL